MEGGDVMANNETSVNVDGAEDAEELFAIGVEGGSRSCLGCYTNPTPITAVDEPSKGLRIQGQSVRKPSISDDFWSTSTYEMENSGVQSQRSISSISASVRAFDPYSGAGSSTNTPEFVNHGLLLMYLLIHLPIFNETFPVDAEIDYDACKGLILWNQTRQQWIGDKKDHRKTEQVIDPRLSSNATYDSLLGTNKPFAHPISLPEMVNFLVFVWEQEGLYD
ncbi:hypothetical protein IEQ34_020921 [Dendrobium chrysotoxum]|uniref:Gag1-like clamp domain-containing protein n=1 Tax=Dendrobium chrysotoxum TaxID=161865 RepID=A0AAV7G3M4_DENCH|nr:hypothetical protein IEQ34_020921 [Dendrobium chrysotoxum]